jgi:hypothetical protein
MRYLAAMLLLCWPAAAGQIGRPLPDVPGTWQLSSPPPASAAKWSGHSEAEGRIFLSTIQGVAARLHSAKVFNPPLGFNGEGYIQFVDHGQCEPTDPCAKVPVAGRLRLIFFYFCEGPGGKPKTDTEAITDAVFYFNALVGEPAFEKLNGQELRWLPQAIGQAAGVTLYYASSPSPQSHEVTAAIYFAKRDRPLWVPVTREQFLQYRIQDREGEVARQAEADKKLAPCDKAYKDWISGAEERRKTTEENYQKLKKTAPAEAERYRADMEKMEAEMPAQFKKIQATCEADRRQRAEHPADPVLETYRAELAGMTPAERASQAWTRGAYDYPSPFVPANTKGARPVVRFNPDYFDLSRPRTDIQLITVLLEEVPENLAEPPLTDWDSLGLIRLWQFVNQVDWQQLAAMISE